MASAEMHAGQAGHAFLASWYINRDLAQALHAFDRAVVTPPRPARPGWYSDSALNLFHECPTKFYLSRLHRGSGVERVYPESSAEVLNKQSDMLATRLSQAKDACQWLASDPEADGSASMDTWGTEVYLETPAPFRFRMWVDHLVWLRKEQALCIRDHKFTWKNDVRVGTRILYGDQLLLYAASWNRWHKVWELPRCDFIMPNAIVVSAKGTHQVMPAEAKFLTTAREERFWSRLHRVQEHIDAFTAQAGIADLDYARQFMQPRSCWVYSPCPFMPVCHDNVPPGPPNYQASTRATLTEDD